MSFPYSTSPTPSSSLSEFFHLFQLKQMEMEARLTTRKLLGEFLLEQQEPFALEAFLLERGCSRSLFNGSPVQMSSSWKRKKGVIQLSKLLRAIQHQIGFFSRSGGQRVGKCSSSESFSSSHSQAAAEADGGSSPSSTTVYISCNESSSDTNSQNQDGCESEIQESIQEDKHLSSSSYRTGLSAKKAAEEEIGGLVCKRVLKWGTTSRIETRMAVTEFVYDHLLCREEEQVWRDHLTHIMEIATEIADGILGDIRDEILAGMSINTRKNL